MFNDNIKLFIIIIILTNGKNVLIFNFSKLISIFKTSYLT